MLDTPWLWSFLEWGTEKRWLSYRCPLMSEMILLVVVITFLGLTSCRAFDRFWATKCRHCQKFGHTKDRCPAKNNSPTCSFCADPQASLDCSDKSVLKCVNCSSLGSPADRCHHSASSLDCPVMISERNRVMENTDFGSSKNTQPPLEYL